MTATRLRSGALSTAVVAVFAVIVAAGVALAGSRASAVFVEITETGNPGFLTLAHDDATPLWATLEPGDSVTWLVRASLHEAESGRLSIELRGSGELVELAGLTGSVDACAGTFDPASLACEGTLTSAVAPVALRDLPKFGGQVQLADISQLDPRELLVTLTLPPDAALPDAETHTARVGLGVHASGAQAPPITPLPEGRPGTPGLAVTGADAFALSVLSVGLIGLGGALILRRRSRQ